MRERFGTARNDLSAMKTFVRSLLAFSVFLLLPACGDEPFVDPVWGEWESRSNGCSARTAFDIGDDYRGDGRIVFGDCSVCQVNIDVDAQGDGEYELEVSGVDCEGTVDFDCELFDDELECEDAVGGRYDLERND
jgi:hypothetical protein